MAKDRVRLSKVSLSFFILRKCSYSNWQIPTRLSPGCWGTMLKRRALSFLRADSCLSRRCSNIKGAISVLKQFLSKHFPDFEAGVLHRKMSRLLWQNVPNKGSRSKQAKRWVQNIILKWNLPSKYFFAQGALLIRANQGHSISTVEVIKKVTFVSKQEILLISMSLLWWR